MQEDDMAVICIKMLEHLKGASCEEGIAAISLLLVSACFINKLSKETCMKSVEYTWDHYHENAKSRSNNAS
jgi:hypothetical protein